ncbi:MAG TPA: ABC transporter ATP-binding protein [Solirubrobacteraceae bacterium]|jgi:putative ABC transport system ATP-binding protein|nr:ABC transporter ATP-binding protein [Solirubrobacteraceae bacterium]
MLELERVYKRFVGADGPIHAVDDVSIGVRPRELLAIFGTSGSGKTTLLLLAAGLIRADAGTIRFDGSDLETFSRRERLEYRRTRLGFVFQGYNLAAGLSAEENVAIPLLLRGSDHRDARRRALGALDDVGLLRRSAHIPSELSGGERQRVAIARALVGSPRLVLADEPTGNLDAQTGGRVLDLFSALLREHGAAAILATHDAHVVRYSDRVLGMSAGRLREPELEQRVAVHP